MNAHSGETPFLSDAGIERFQRTWGFLTRYEKHQRQDIPLDLVTRQEVAEQLGITHQRVQQIESRALKKLWTKACAQLGHEPKTIWEILEAFRHEPTA